MDKQRDLSGGELADTMKNGEGTGVEGETGLAVFRVVGGVFRGGLVDKCLVSGCKSWKVVLQSDVYERRWREGNVNRYSVRLRTQVHSGYVHLRQYIRIRDSIRKYVHRKRKRERKKEKKKKKVRTNCVVGFRSKQARARSARAIWRELRCFENKTA